MPTDTPFRRVGRGAPLCTLAVALGFTGLVGIAAGAAPAVGQQPDADAEPRALVGTVFDSTSVAPLRGAAVYLVGTDHVGMTDGQGRFALVGVDAGSYTLSIRHARLDTLGVETAPEWQVEVQPEGLTQVALAVPSLATLMPGLCVTDPSQRGILMGVVRDGATGTPLPEADVRIESEDQTFATETDAQGRFVRCGLPTGVPLAVEADFYQRAPASRGVLLEPDNASFQTFSLELSEGVEVTGQVVDDATGEAIEGALVRLETSEGEQARAVSDTEGRFRFDRLGLDTYLVQVTHVAYGTQVRWFNIDDVTPIELELGMVSGAIELEALVVTVSTPEVERANRSGVRTDFISREEIETLIGSAQNAGDLLRTLPAVRVSYNRNPRTSQMELCVEARRSYGAGCDPVTVILDGIRSDAEILAQIPPDQIESIEFIPAVIAGIQYGTRTGSGVLEVRTR